MAPRTPPTSGGATARFVLLLSSLYLAIWIAYFIVVTWHWPLVGDASLIHYAVFLTQHGFAPYRDITDINMPGAYLTDWLVLHTFGTGAIGWRLFDLALAALAGLAMQSIAAPSLRIPAWMAAGVLLLLHGQDGIAQTGQRDLVIAVLLLGAYACLYRVLRVQSGSPAGSRRSASTCPLWLAAAGFLAAWSATIKPTVLPFLLALALFAILQLRSHRLACALSGLVGLVLPFALVLLYLWRWHSLLAFLATVRGVVRVHAGLDHRSLGFLLAHCTSPIMVLVALWLATTWRQNWRSWERLGLALAMAFGLLNYLAQAKGYQYHRYPLLAFLLLVMAIDFTRSLRSTHWTRWISAVAVALTLLYFVPVSALKAAHYDGRNQEFIRLIESDLTGQTPALSSAHISPATLTGRVQCLDTTTGCINALYDLRLVQSTGLLYDCYLLLPQQTPATLALRTRYLGLWQQHPPEAFVVSNQFCLGNPRSFDKLHNWPALERILSQDYKLAAQRTPPHLIRWWSRPETPGSYRLYLRKHLP